jgi:hypothetical protein
MDDVKVSKTEKTPLVGCWSHRVQREPVGAPKHWLIGRTVVLLVLLFSIGCQRWPGTNAMRQAQVESDRLLAEFRAQKRRADDLENRNVQLEQRLGEAEKMLALKQGRSGSRVAESGSAGIRSGGDRSLSDLGAPTPSSRRIPGTGLPDSNPSTPGRLTSVPSYGNDDMRGDPNRTNQWRPIPGR